MHHGQIARVEPAAREGATGRVQVAVVAEHDVIAADNHLSDGGAVTWYVAHVVVHDTQPLTHHRSHSLARAQPLLLRGGPIVPVGVPRADRDWPVRLGQAVQMRYRHVELSGAREERR